VITDSLTPPRLRRLSFDDTSSWRYPSPPPHRIQRDARREPVPAGMVSCVLSSEGIPYVHL